MTGFSCPGVVTLAGDIVLCSWPRHSQCLSPPRCMGTDEFNSGGKPCDGLASYPGGGEWGGVVLLAASETRISSGLMGQVCRLYFFIASELFIFAQSYTVE